LFIFSTLALNYLLFTLYLTYLLLRLTKNNSNIKNLKYLSLIKDWEFINFKFNLFNFYYSTVILNFTFLFKNNYLFNISLDSLSTNSMVNQTNIYFLLAIITLASILVFITSNNFILFLFKIYLRLKNIINSLNEIKFNKQNMEIINKFKPTIFTHIRSFSTYTKNNNIKELENNILDQDNLTYNSDKSIKKQLKVFIS